MRNEEETLGPPPHDLQGDDLDVDLAKTRVRLRTDVSIDRIHDQIFPPISRSLRFARRSLAPDLDFEGRIPEVGEDVVRDELFHNVWNRSSNRWIRNAVDLRAVVRASRWRNHVVRTKTNVDRCRTPY